MIKRTAICPLRVATIALIAGFSLITLTGTGCQPGAKTIRLRFKHTPGATYSYQLTKKSNARMMEADSVIWKESRVANKTIEDYVRSLADDSTAEIVEKTVTSFDNISTNDTAVIDSGLYHSEVLIRIQPNGKVVEFEFSDSEDPPPLDYYSHLYQQAYPVFPSGELLLGRTWSQDTRVMLDDGPSEASTTYELRSFVRERGYDCVVIAFDGNLVVPLERYTKDAVTITGINRTTFTGVMYFAYKEGLVISTRCHWVTDGHREKSGGGRRLGENRVIFEGDDNLVLRTLSIPSLKQTELAAE